MTSKPASLKARATTLAPRSWPSSPGLATRMRIFRFSAMFQLLPCDHDALHLAGPLVDPGDAGVAQVTLHRKLANVSVPPVDLDRLVAHAAGLFARPQLGDRRLARKRQAGLLAPGGAQHQRPPRLAGDGHVGEHHLDRLVLGEGDVELHALASITHRRGESGLGDPDRLRRDADPPPV